MTDELGAASGGIEGTSPGLADSATPSASAEGEGGAVARGMDGGRRARGARVLREPDPGSPRARSVAWLFLVPLLAAVIWFQHGAAPEPAQKKAEAVTAPTTGEPFTLMARLLVKVARALGPADPSVAETVMGELEPMARTPVEKLRLAVVAAELKGGDEGLKRLDAVEESLDEAERKAEERSSKSAETPAAEKPAATAEAERAALRIGDGEMTADDVERLRESVDRLRVIYRAGGGAEGLAEEDRRELVAQHGWFGKLALSYGKDDADPDRAALLSGGGAVIAVLLLTALVMGVAVLTGFVLFIVMVVMAASGKLRPAFRAPAPGGSVYLETVAVFLGAFLVLKGMSSLLEHYAGNAAWAGPVHMLLQWSVLPVIFWPVVRGVTWSRLRMDMGWHRGRGVLREIGAGIVGYLAGLPLLLFGAAVSLVLFAIKGYLTRGPGGAGGGPVAPENPIFEVVSKGSPLMLFLLYTLATLWAPIVEEAVFRGALFRHLRSRVRLGVAAVVTAMMFGIAHGYEVVLLGPVMALGFTFALLREWRGSLIASMTGHFLHNGFVLALLIVVMSLVGK